MTTENAHAARDGGHGAAAKGLAVFAAALLILAGAGQILTAISALANDEILVTTPNWVFKLDLTTWGWVHLVIGVIAVLVGVFILLGARWAAIVGIVIAGVSAIANFMWLPHYPLWSIVVIALDVAIIWALAPNPNVLRTDSSRG
jgi:hypothetical protein